MTDDARHETPTGAGPPLTPSVARRLITTVLEKSVAPMKRAELAQQVLKLHLAEGGAAGRQPPQSIVKKALGYLREDGKVESADGFFGSWRLRSSSHAGLPIADNPTGLVNDDNEELIDDVIPTSVLPPRSWGPGQSACMYITIRTTKS